MPAIPIGERSVTPTDFLVVPTSPIATILASGMNSTRNTFEVKGPGFTDAEVVPTSAFPVTVDGVEIRVSLTPTPVPTGTLVPSRPPTFSEHQGPSQAGDRGAGSYKIGSIDEHTQGSNVGSKDSVNDDHKSPQDFFMCSNCKGTSPPSRPMTKEAVNAKLKEALGKVLSAITARGGTYSTPLFEGSSVSVVLPLQEKRSSKVTDYLKHEALKLGLGLGAVAAAVVVITVCYCCLGVCAAFKDGLDCCCNTTGDCCLCIVGDCLAAGKSIEARVAPPHASAVALENVEPTHTSPMQPPPAYHAMGPPESPTPHMAV